MTMKVRVLLAAVVVMISLASVGCGHYTCGATFGSSTCSGGNGGLNNGNNGGQPTGDAYVYVANPGGIQGMTLEEAKGTLVDNCTPSTCPSGLTDFPTGTPEWAVIAQKKILYVEYSPSADLTSSIYTWTLAPDGLLTNGASTVYPYPLPFRTTGGGQAMIENPAGTFLFVIDATAGNPQIDVYQIGSSGGLTQVGVPVSLPSGFQPYNLAIDGLGKYLYVSNISGSSTTKIMAYSISNGVLSTVTGSPFSLNLIQMQGDPTGKYLIGTTATLTNSDPNLYVLGIAQSGAISLLGSAATINSPNSVVIQPGTGALVYSFNLVGGTVGGNVEGYTLNPLTGQLSIITGSPFTAGGDAGQFDQAGKLLFVRDLFGKNMSVYDVSSSFTLSSSVGSQSWDPDPWAWAVTDPN